jgi:SAM-dependent methyltransferase
LRVPIGEVSRTVLARPSDVSDAQARNKALYENGWRYFRLESHTLWSVWQQIEPFAGTGTRMLEIGPGKWPHLPVDQADFVDLCEEAVRALRAAGARCSVGAMPLPYADASFDLACFFELIEHVDDDAALLAEVARVLRPGGVVFLSCPMNPDYWTHYDAVIGHVRRYRAQELAQRLDAGGFAIEGVCPRADRMNSAFGWMFGFGVEHATRLTTALIARALPHVAARAWPWRDPGVLAEAERLGGVTLRARRR